MVLDQMGALLEELSKEIKIPLKPDTRNGCLLRYRKQKIDIHLEMEHNNEQLLVVTYFPLPPSGGYRERIMRIAMVENHSYPDAGVFAVSIKEENLVFFQKFPLKELTGQKVADFLGPFVEKASMWKKSLEEGETPVSFAKEVSKPKGFFGL